MKKDIDKFPSIDNVHEVLSDLTGLFNDRTKLLDTMFREDKYKEFLLAENMQQLAEADKRDDSANGRIKKDLANGYEVLKAKTTMQKFANFLSPGAIPQMDLTTTEDFKDDGDYEEEEAPVEKEAPEKGDKGDKGDDGEDGGLLDTAANLTPGNISGIDNLDKIPGASQNPGLKLAEGGAVSPSPMMNALNPSAQRPESKSGVKTLESLGLVGKKNVASELTEDLGLEEYKKALSDAMALPLKAVAAGLAGLMDKVDVPGGEGAAVEGQISKIGQTFGVPVPKKKKQNRLMNFVKGGGLAGMAVRALLPKRKKKRGPQTEEEAMAQMSSYEQEVQNMSDPHGSEETMEDYAPKGGPSLGPGYLGIGGASHEPVAPDQLSNQGDTKIDMMKNSISNIAQGAKNIFKKTAPGAAISATSSVLNKILGGVQPADKGSQYESQDINALTNQVVQQNEQMVNNQTQMQIGGVAGSEGEAESTQAIMDAIAKMSTSDLGITEADPLPPAPLKPSKHLLHSIAIVDGGQTPHDIL